MLERLTSESSAMRFLSWPRRALTNSWRCLAMWYSAFSLRSPSAAAFLISCGSSCWSSCSICRISSSNFFLMCSGMAISVTAWEKHKPQGTAGIRYPPKPHYTTPDGLRNRREEGDAATLRVEPALQDEGGGELVDFAAGSLARVVAGGFQGGMSLCGGEALVPEMNGEAGAVRGGVFRGIFVSPGWRFGDERLEFIDKAVDAVGLPAAISGEGERIADDDAGAVVTACEPEDGALSPARLSARAS